MLLRCSATFFTNRCPAQDVDVSDVSDQTVPQDPSENVEHLPEEAQ